MKILHIHVGLSLLGGAESVIVNLANEMAKTNEVKVCSIFTPLRDGLFYTRFSDKVERLTIGLNKPGFSIANLFSIYNYLRTVDADIIHIHGYFVYYLLPIFLLHNQKKFVYTIHSDAKKECSKWDQRLLFLKKHCFKQGWLSPITISPESQESFFDLYHLNSKLIKNGIAKPIIDNAVNDIDKARINPTTKVFLHPGRINIPKNQVVLCSVFKRMISEGLDVVLLIAGTKQREEIFHQLESFFCDRIRYLGERNDVPQLMARADAFCLPSIWEGLPITLLEALSVGCIPICSPVGGIVGVIEDGKNGLLSKSSSEEDFYVAMKRYLLMTDIELKKMKKACIQSFEPYEISYAVKEHLSYYKDIIDSSHF